MTKWRKRIPLEEIQQLIKDICIVLHDNNLQCKIKSKNVMLEITSSKNCKDLILNHFSDRLDWFSTFLHDYESDYVISFRIK